MSPRSPKQINELKKVKRKLIMDTALELFADSGYYKTSINMIAEKAGIAKGLIYTYFENKDDLLKELVFSGIAEFDKIFDTKKDGYLTDNEFEFFVDESFNLLQKNLKFWRLYFLLVMKKEILELFSDKFAELTLPFFNTLTEYYKRKSHKKPHVDAILFGSMMDGVSMNYIIDPENFPLKDIKELIIERFK